jgi:hypothetical protein
MSGRKALRIQAAAGPTMPVPWQWLFHPSLFSSEWLVLFFGMLLEDV